MSCQDLTCPRPDPLTARRPHSEYAGLTARHSYIGSSKSLCSRTSLIPIPTWPPSWPRVQGPLHHPKLYSLPEHARWSVVGSKRPTFVLTSYRHSEISQIQFIKLSNVLQLPLPATAFSWATASLKTIE
jgi:hypothetical protein